MLKFLAKWFSGNVADALVGDPPDFDSVDWEVTPPEAFCTIHCKPKALQVPLLKLTDLFEGLRPKQTQHLTERANQLPVERKVHIAWQIKEGIELQVHLLKLSSEMVEAKFGGSQEVIAQVQAVLEQAEGVSFQS